ncbi:hypothetical protein BH23CHL6_BH23CHL6_08590 [soil metagenome]
MVVAAFGGLGSPVPLSGGEGRSWRAGGIVLKLVGATVDELEWQAAVLGSVQSRHIRLAPPLRTADGKWVVDGWCAAPFMAGTHAQGRWADVIRAGEALHAALATHPRPTFLDRRTDRWAVADRVAWEELTVERFSGTAHVARLAAARQPLQDPAQLIHGDLTGNVLFAPDLPPAIIDFSVYWRPRPFASAIVVADAIVWEGADRSVLEAVIHAERSGHRDAPALEGPRRRSVFGRRGTGAEHLRLRARVTDALDFSRSGMGGVLPGGRAVGS